MAFNVTVDLGDAGDIGSVKLQSCTGNGSGCVDIAGSTSVAVPSGLPKTVSVPDGTTYIRAVALGDCSSATPLSIQVTGLPTTNTFGNGVNGAAPIYPMLNLGGGSLWSLTLSSTSGIFSITDYQVTYGNTNTTSGNTNSQPLNMSGTSSLSEIYFIIQGNNTPTGGIDGFSSLKITDGTNNYNGVGTEEYNDKFRVTFNIGSAKGRTFYWGQASSATIGVLEIEDA